MTFFQVWFASYTHPARLVDGLKGKPAPQWGFYAQLLRAGLDSLLLYLPLFLLERIPPLPSFIHWIPTESYYGALIVITPFVFAAQWLLGGAAMHVILRLSMLRSDIDQILNLTGMATLVVGAFLVVWDWVWLVIGGMNQYSLGISHLVIDLWAFVIVVSGLKRLFGTPIWLGILLCLLSLLLALPLAIMFMRSPL